MFDKHMFKEYTNDLEKYPKHFQTNNFVIPSIIEKGDRGERMYDLFSRLMEDRIIIIGGVINEFVAAIVTGQLLFLQKENKNQDISIYIMSPGGGVTAGLSIYDTMQFVACDTSTFAIGMAASMGAVILTGGTKGKRYSLPHSRIMIHQPWGGIGGTAEDIKRQAEEVLEEKKILIDILAQHSGKSVDVITKDVDRDNFMSPLKAVEYGLIDEVITTLKEEK